MARQLVTIRNQETYKGGKLVRTDWWIKGTCPECQTAFKVDVPDGSLRAGDPVCDFDCPHCGALFVNGRVS